MTSRTTDNPSPLQPIETAPRDGAWILGWSAQSIQEEEKAPLVSQCRWVIDIRDTWERVTPDRQERREEDWSHWSDYENHTHWMPLPTSPD